MTKADMKVGVVGAGISGLAAARMLHHHGCAVQVFEKARGPGGRASTRRRPDGVFDHGAQYFTVRDETFRTQVNRWVHRGVARKWGGRMALVNQGNIQPGADGPERYVGVPGMSALARDLSGDLRVAYNIRVRRLDQTSQGWIVINIDDQRLGPFDAIVLAMPPAQVAPLLDASPALQRIAAGTHLKPCWAVMMRFNRPLALPFDGAFVHQSPLSWVAMNGSKPERPADEAWVLHASPEWSSLHLEDDSDDVAKALVSAFFTATGATPIEPILALAHRWRYAIPDPPLQNACLHDAKSRIVVCGDWCAGARVEGAYLSGHAAAHCLVSA